MNDAPVNPAEKRVAGKVALVTGAASGIGRATALMLASHGAVAVCADVNLAGAKQTAAMSAAGKKGSVIHLDVTSESAWQKTMEHVLKEHGQLDVLVNCAGISFARSVPEMTLAEWRRVMAVNLEGVFLGTKHGILAMRHHQRGGSIINVSSASGIKPSPGASAYCASKAAVCMFTKTAAKECAEKGDHIRINTVCPGGVKTPLWKTMPFFRDLVEKTGSEEAAFEAMTQSSPRARFAEPAEIASAILFLASDESRYVTGTDLIIDGGLVV